MVGRYRGSVMGLMWSFAHPIVMLLVYTFVFSFIFKVRWGTGDASNTNFALNLFVGILIHAFFAECTNRAPSLMADNINYVKKVVFPLWVLPVVLVVSSLFHMLVGFLVLFGCVLIFLDQLYLTTLLIPLLFLPFILMVAGTTWLFSALGVYLRDLSQVLPVISTVMLFLAPVFYPITALPEAFQHYLYLNPLTYIIDESRNLILLGRLPNFEYLAYFYTVSILLALSGWSFFKKTKQGFADVL